MIHDEEIDQSNWDSIIGLYFEPPGTDRERQSRYWEWRQLGSLLLQLDKYRESKNVSQDFNIAK